MNFKLLSSNSFPPLFSCCNWQLQLLHILHHPYFQTSFFKYLRGGQGAYRYLGVPA
jgi:hypothetical protein